MPWKERSVMDESTSIWRPGFWNLSTTRSVRGCHYCVRYEVLPMSPERTREKWSGREDLNLRPPGFEPVLVVYLVASLSTVLRLVVRFCRVFVSIWTQIGPKSPLTFLGA